MTSASAYTGNFSEGAYHISSRQNFESLSDLDEDDDQIDRPYESSYSGKSSGSTTTPKKSKAPEATSIDFTELLDDFKTGVVFTCFTYLMEFRDRILAAESQSNLVIKGVVWLAAEVGFVAMIPLASIEAIFRFTLSWLAYPLAALGVISTENDYFYYGMSVTYPVGVAVAIGSVHAAIVNLNPRRSIEDDLKNGLNYCPILNTLKNQR